jgi:hypothetical protein
MHLRQLLLLGLIIGWIAAKGQIIPYTDAYSFSLSGSGAALSNLYSVNNNQAGLAFYRKTAFAINYHNKYFIPELAGQSAIAATTIGKGTAGASICHFGARSLNESKFSLAYGRQLFSWLGAGIEMNYHRLEIEAVGDSRSIVSGNIGLQAIPMEYMIIGVQLENPTNSSYSNSETSVLYSGLKTGISYAVLASFLITSQLDWDSFERIVLVVGGEYWLIKNLSLRFGARLINSPAFSFGTGIVYHQTGIDFGFEQHPVLGLSATVSINIKLRGQ